jgi:uncharacterized protein (DUF58 family)
MEGAMRIPKPSSWRLPREGFYWLWTAVLVIAVGLFKSINLLTLLGYVLLAVFALNALVAGRRLRSLRVRRRVGEPVFAQTPVPVEVQVTNPGRAAVLGVHVGDLGPDHALGWFASRLEGHACRSFRQEVVLPRRGRYDWGPVVAVSGVPFGLIRRRVVLAPGEPVVVLPRLGWLHRGRLRHFLRSAAVEGERVRRRPQRHASAQAEFHGLRPYHTGDSPRTIHWRTSARRGELMVREFEDSPTDNLLLVFDPSLSERWKTEGGRRKKEDDPASLPSSAFDLPSFEAAVSLAATICWEWCRCKGDRLVAALAGPDPAVLSGTAGPVHARRVLEALAVQRPGGRTDPRALVARLTTTSLPPAAVVLVSVGPSDLAGCLRQTLNRPVNCLDATTLDELNFYEPPRPPR